MKRDDLETKSMVGIFLGYNSNSKGYQIYNLETRKILVSIYVNFESSLNGIGRKVKQKVQARYFLWKIVWKIIIYKMKEKIMIVMLIFQPGALEH